MMVFVICTSSQAVAGKLSNCGMMPLDCQKKAVLKSKFLWNEQEY